MFRVIGLGETRLKASLNIFCVGSLSSELVPSTLVHWCLPNPTVLGEFSSSAVKILGERVPCQASMGNYCLCHDNEYMLY